MRKSLTLTVIVGAIALAMSVVPVSAAIAAPTATQHNHSSPASASVSSAPEDTSACWITVDFGGVKETLGFFAVGVILDEYLGIAVPGGIPADVLLKVVQCANALGLGDPPTYDKDLEGLTCIGSDGLPAGHVHNGACVPDVPSQQSGGGTGVPGANNPTTPTQSSPNPSTNLTCANIPGGCSHSGDTFTSGGTGVVRNGVSYGIPEGGYCENAAGTAGVIHNNACGTAL